MKYLLRILVLPFVFMLVLVKLNYEVLLVTYLFLRYGGEFANYNVEDQATIKDIYNELINQRTHI